MQDESRVAAWGRGHDEQLVQLALAVFSSADETIAIIRGEPAPSTPPDGSHLSFYRDHRRLMRLVSQLAERPHEPQDKPEAVRFLIEIWLRCVFTYLITPGRLLRAARHGEPKALDDLLRLDKAVICEPRVAKQLVAIFDRRRPALKKRITAALMGRPTLPPRGTLKARMAGLVLAIINEDERFVSRGVEAPTPSELRDLFDAIAQDADQQQPCDSDLPEGDDAWRKAVQRARSELRPFVRLAIDNPLRTRLAP